MGLVRPSAEASVALRAILIIWSAKRESCRATKAENQRLPCLVTPFTGPLLTGPPDVYALTLQAAKHQPSATDTLNSPHLAVSPRGRGAWSSLPAISNANSEKLDYAKTNAV